MKVLDIIFLIGTVGLSSGDNSVDDYSELYAIKMFEDKISTAKLLKNVTTSSKFDCATECLKDEDCESFFIKASMSQCQLHSVTFVDTSMLLNESGWKYYKAYTDLCRPYIKQDYAESKKLKFCYKLYIMPEIDLFAYKATCENDGGELMKIDSQNKQNYMASFLKHVDSPINYINANDSLTEGTWLYDDGTPLVFTNWNTPNGEPGGGTGENYAMMRSSYNYKWHDADVSYSLKGALLCQKVL